MICRMDVNMIHCGPDVTWWVVVYGWSLVWLVGCHSGSMTMALVCWMGLPWAAYIVAVAIPLLWSGVASVQVTTAGAAMSVILRLWSQPVSPFSIFLVVSRAWPGVAISVHLVMLCWCTWRCHFMRAVHNYISVFFKFLASDVRAVLCDVSWFLALKTLIIFVWHHVDHWGWKDGWSKMLCCIEFLYLGNGIL